MKIRDMWKATENGILPKSWIVWIRVRRAVFYILTLICVLGGAVLTGPEKGEFIIHSLFLALAAVALVALLAQRRKNRKKADFIAHRLSPYISSDMPQRPYGGKTFALACRAGQETAGTVVAGYLKTVGMKQVPRPNETTHWVVVDFDDLPTLNAYRYRKGADGAKQLVYDRSYDYDYAVHGKPVVEQALDLKNAGCPLAVYSARSLAEHFDLTLPRKR